MYYAEDRCEKNGLLRFELVSSRRYILKEGMLQPAFSFKP